MISEFYINFNLLKTSTPIPEKGVTGSRNSFTELTTAINKLNECSESYSIILRVSSGPNVYENNKRERKLEYLIAELSKREIEVFELAMRGFGVKETSEKLFISIDTVKTHRKNVVKKAGGKIEEIKNWFLEAIFFRGVTINHPQG